MAAPTSPLALPDGMRAVYWSWRPHGRQVFLAALVASWAPAAFSEGTCLAACLLQGGVVMVSPSLREGYLLLVVPFDKVGEGLSAGMLQADDSAYNAFGCTC